MADHGAIGMYPALFAVRPINPVTGANPRVVSQLSYTRLLPTWAVDYRGLLAIPVHGALSGVVKQAGTPVENRWVRLYYRKNGFLIGAVRSGADGDFSFGGLDPGAQYFVIAFDDLNQAPDFNAVIFDQLIPV
jgi:hypothetical protein